MTGAHRDDESRTDDTYVDEPYAAESSDETYADETYAGEPYAGRSADASYAEGTDVATSVEGGAETVRHEERLAVGTQVEEIGQVHVRKRVESHPVEYSVPRDVEHVDTNERISVDEGDSGEVELLDDGSVSIPVFEEVLVVTKRLVVRERVIVRKRTVVDEYKLQTELRREHVEVDADDSVDLKDDTTQPAPYQDQHHEGDATRQP